MRQTSFVKHISGVGKRWEVVKTQEHYFVTVEDYTLPRSDYEYCLPPERWVDVTQDCEMRKGLTGGYNLYYEGEQHKFGHGNFRLSKVPLTYPLSYSFPAVFIIEKRVEGGNDGSSNVAR